MPSTLLAALPYLSGEILNSRTLLEVSTQMHVPRIAVRCIPLALLAVGCARDAVPAPGAHPPLVVANDNRIASGTVRNGLLSLDLDVVMGRWYPEAADGPFVDVPAFAESGKAPMIPAPLLRVPVGTRVRLVVRNTIANAVIGLWGVGSTIANDTSTVPVRSGESHVVEFTATKAGTYMYGARSAPDGPDAPETEQLAGAIVVDEPGVQANDRIFVVNIWSMMGSDSIFRNIYAISGRSWPYTEHFDVTEGDTLRWRVVNPSIEQHPMHLHGAYFRVDAPSDGGHEAHSTDPRKHMAGLVLGVSVRPRTPALARTPARQIAAEIARGIATDTAHLAPIALRLWSNGRLPAPAQLQPRGDLIVLTRGEPTDITVHNALTEPTAIHWHGLELESWSDGVVGLSGVGTTRAPSIAPGDSFVARLTLKRAGTFIYHTHLNDFAQLTAGLYGPLVVLEPGQQWDPDRDLIFTAGEDRTKVDGPVVNGGSTEAPFHLPVRRPVRMRFINIQPEWKATFEVLRDSAPVLWRPLAKDGFELPVAQGVSGQARRSLWPGETFDAEFLPTAPGTCRIRMISEKGLVAYERRVVVRP